MLTPSAFSFSKSFTSFPHFSSALKTFSTGSKRLIALAGIALALSACGGGGGGGGFSNNGTTPPQGGSGGSTAPVLNIGSGSGSAFQDGVVSSSLSSVAAGQTTTLRVNISSTGGTPPTTTQSVRFTSVCISTGRATLGAITEITTGLFSADYTNSGCDGPDIVTATLVSNNDTATVTLTTVGPQVLTVTFVSSTLDQLSLAGIGGNESTEITFKVAGPQGVPVVGKQVTFSVNTQVGGAAILAGRTTGVTDQQGLVRTVLNSGTVAGPVNVKAVHTESGRQGLSSDIVISTGVPQASRFSISYNPFNPRRAYNTDGVTVTISLIVSDAFGNNPTDGTRISFVAPESGNVQNSCLLDNGTCSVIWRSSSPRPADGRVEVLAYTDGAEDFIDTNGNSVYDAKDGSILDLGEPYADQNENGTYDLGEYFFDTNRNGVRNSGNGQWDGPCLIKVDPTADCTGNDTVTIYDSVTIAMSTNIARFLNSGNFPPTGTPITITQGTSLNFAGLILADSNSFADSLGSNPLPNGTTVTFVIEGAGVTLQGLTTDTIGNAVAPTGPYGTTLVARTVDPSAALPTGIRLLLNITVPGESIQQFSWPIDVVR